MPPTSPPSVPQPAIRTAYRWPKPLESPLVMGLAALFILPFVVIGLSFLLFGTGAIVADWVRAQSWHATQAVVESAASVREPYSKGGGGYRAEVLYRYEVDGTVYQGHRASFHRGPDQAFQKQLGDRLEEAQRSGSRVQVWVNPAQPAESVVDRSLRPASLALSSIVGLGFTGLGLGLWWILLLAWRRQRLERKAMAAQNAASPPETDVLTAKVVAPTHTDEEASNHR